MKQIKLGLPILIIVVSFIMPAFMASPERYDTELILKQSDDNQVLAIVNSDQYLNNRTLILEIEVTKGIWKQYKTTVLEQKETSFEVSCNNNYRVKLIDPKSHFVHFHLRNELKSNVVRTQCDHLKDDVLVYPNPTSDELYIRSHLDTPIESVSIIASNGQIVKQSFDGSSINTSELVTGNYVVKITLIDKSTLISKFVKL